MEGSIPDRLISVEKILTHLQQQIELASKINNYSFINEIAIENFIKNVVYINENNQLCYDKNFRTHINSLLSYLVYLFESNNDQANNLWLIHCSILKFVHSTSLKESLEGIVSSGDMMQEVNLLSEKDFIDLSMICLLELNQLTPHVIEFYKKIQNENIVEESDYVQSICTKLRNSLYQKPLYSSMVLDILSKSYRNKLNPSNQNIKGPKLDIFYKIYSQALIYSLKNQNKNLLIQIILRCPDDALEDDNLVREIVDFFQNSNNSNDDNDKELMSLYTISLFSASSKFMKFLSSNRKKFENTEKKDLKPFFNSKQCFLLAVHDKKHFLREFIDFFYQNHHRDNIDFSVLPLKSHIIISLTTLYNIIENYKDFSQSQEKFSKLESNLCDLFVKFDEIDHSDSTFDHIVEKIRFIFDFSDWCSQHNQSNIVEKNNFRYEIIVQLMSGTSPLKILSSIGFFELKIRKISYETFKNEIICDYVCDIIDRFDKNVAMILKGFIVIRLVIFFIFSKQKENIYFDSNLLQGLLADIYPINFRLEIMENLFSLLFITKNDIRNDPLFNSEDEDYFDETINEIKSTKLDSLSSGSKKNFKSRMEKNTNFSNTSNFICPNWLIPKLLEVLKDILYKTNSDLFTNRNYFEDHEEQQIKDDDNFEQEDLRKLKSRINTLLKYVGDAQFRYDVIRPAFFKCSSNIHPEVENNIVHSNKSSNIPEINETTSLTSAAFSASSDTDNKSGSNRDTSLISCMLASHTQLLCYTLTENRLESSGQIVKLFENELKNSKPYKELQMLEYLSEFHTQVSQIHSCFSDSFSHQRKSSKKKNQHNRHKINEITSLGIRSSRIQSLLYEMLMKMDQIEIETKIIFMLDYALSSSPSLEIAQSILESVFLHNNNLLAQSTKNGKKILPGKIESFVIDIEKLIKNLSHQIDISNISMSDFLKKSLISSSGFTLETESFIQTIKTEIEMCRWYYKFYTLLMDLERQIIDDPDSILETIQDPNQSELQNKSNQLNHYYDQIMNNCPLGKYQYLKALYLYVCKVNKALVECRKRNNTNDKNLIDTSILCSSSLFSILKQSPSAILCSMVIKSKISPKIIDDMAQVMKVNLIGVLCSVFCPTIPSTFLFDPPTEFTIMELCQPSISELVKSYLMGAERFKAKLDDTIVVNDYFGEDALNSSMDDSFQPIINQDVLNYFHSKCPILVQILRLLNLVNDLQISSISLSSPTLQVFTDSPLIKWIELIKKTFYCNDLHRSIAVLPFYARIPAGENVVMKTLEHLTSNKNYLQIYELFQYIENFPANNFDGRNFSPSNDDDFILNKYQVFQNAIYSSLAFIKEDAKYIFQIVRDPKMKADLILTMLEYSSNYEETFYATRLVRLALQSIRDDETCYKIDATEYISKLEMTLKEIEFYASVGQLTGLKTWKLAKNNLSNIDVLTIIKTRKRYSLAIDWFDIHGFENETSDLLMELLIYAYSEANDYSPLKKLFQMFLDDPKSNNVILITEKILNQAENLELRSFLVEFLIQYYQKRSIYVIINQYERCKLGLEMVKLLSHNIQHEYLDLIPVPLLLIEQLLMNSEIEALEKIINLNKLFKADELIEKYAQKSVYIELYDCNSFDGSDMTVISSESSQTTSRSILQFVVPSKVPSKEQWVSDTSKTHCMLCQIVRFSMINRRHHCRRCGRVVCHSCSTNNLLIPEISSIIPVRVCDDCFNWYTKGRKASVHSLDSSQTTLKRTNWKLSATDDSLNQTRRSEFTYESAPSVSLCLAILRLHSNKTKSCKFIIDKICAPLIESTSYRNVDSTLLIEMIRSLLISTKLQFEEEANMNPDDDHHDSSMEIEQLNLYLDRLDVIRMLINANCGTRENIGYVLNNNIRKLQEKLLESERFELTVDIAKKYGIESSPIWKSWALICLKYFHFVDARQKFTRYFDQVKRFGEVQQTLKMIIATLVSINSMNSKPSLLKDRCSQIIRGQSEFLTETNVISNTDQNVLLKTNRISQSLKPRLFQEIVYYLETYGSKDDQLQFYVNYSYWKEAIECFLSMNRNNPSLANQMTVDFLQKIFIPAQVNGHLSELFSAIRLCDPQQISLESCLISICKYLDKSNFYHCLFRVQVFMNDYLRAAITQINHFFLNKSIEIEQVDNKIINLDGFGLLLLRVNHLEKARDYCNMYLHNMEFVKVKSGCLVVDKKDVFKQIRMIELQIDLLKRFKTVSYPITIRLHGEEELEHYMIEWPVNDKPLFLSAYVLHILEQELSIQITRLSYPPTLLEHDSIRRSLITAFIILYYDQQNYDEGFRCALRIIQDHQLDPEIVYRMATIFLVSHHLERNQNVEQISNNLKQLLTCIHSSSFHHEDQGSNLMVQQTSSNVNASTKSNDKLSDDIIEICLRFIETIMSILMRLNQNHQNQISFATGLSRTKLSELKECLIKLISDNRRRIKAYLKVGKLKLAYLLAASLGQSENIQLVLDAARIVNDQHYVKICEMWFRKNANMKNNTNNIK